MPDPMKTHGMFSWNELLTTDVSAAKAFYTGLLGWTTEDMPMPDMHMAYTVAKVGDTPVAGMMSMPPDVPKGMPPVWGSYITVSDVEAATRKAVELGGSIIKPPTNIPEVGRFCVLADPQGAVFSMIQYVEMPK